MVFDASESVVTNVFIILISLTRTQTRLCLFLPLSRERAPCSTIFYLLVMKFVIYNFAFLLFHNSVFLHYIPKFRMFQNIFNVNMNYSLKIEILAILFLKYLKDSHQLELEYLNHNQYHI